MKGGLSDGCSRASWFKEWGVRPEDEAEQTSEETRLHALEMALADVRRLLIHASRIRPTPYRPDVVALSALAEQLHHRVLEKVIGASGTKP